MLGFADNYPRCCSLDLILMMRLVVFCKLRTLFFSESNSTSIPMDRNHQIEVTLEDRHVTDLV